MRNLATGATLVLILFLLGTSHSFAQEQCATATRAKWDTAPAKVRLNFSMSPYPVPEHIKQAVFSGMASWNECNTNYAFPEFVGPDASAGTTIEILYYDATWYDPETGKYQCGGYQHADRAIYLYSKYYDTNTQKVYPCFSASNLEFAADTVAHELGHYLGLANVYDASCPDFIMTERRGIPNASQTEMTWNTSRQVQLAECQKADSLNTVVPPSTSGGGGSGVDVDPEEDSMCGYGQEAWAIDCGADGDYDYVECLNWWEDEWERGAEVCWGAG